MNPYDTYPPRNLFSILGEDYDMVFVGFPVWKAHIAAVNTDVWVDFIPDLNAAKKTITLPKRKKRKQQDLFSDQSGSSVKITSNPEKIIVNFINTVPEEILELTARFPDSHWALITAVKLIGNDFLLLMKSNPALAYIIVNLGKLNPFFEYLTNIDLLHNMIKTKRKEILRLGGLPGTNIMLKVLSKIDPLIFNIELFLSLKQIVENSDKYYEKMISVLTFAKQIDKKLINLITANHKLLEVLSNKIIFQLVEDPLYRSKRDKIMSMIADAEEIGLSFPVIDSLHKLDSIKEKFDERVNIKKKKLDIFPEPPITGNEYIIPITTNKELQSWSKRQFNCIRGYSHNIRSGKSYLYKVIYEKEEATLEIKIDKESFRKGEFKGFDNKQVSQQLKNIVKDWLKNAREKKPLNIQV